MTGVRWLPLLAATLLAACGGSGEGDDYITSAQITDTFQERTGETLLRDEVGSFDRLDFGNDLEDDEIDPQESERLDRYGFFSVYVIRPPDEGDEDFDVKEEIDDLIESEDDQFDTYETDSEPDFDDITWQKRCPRDDVLDEGCDYIAYKRYGPNVLLNWTSPVDSSAAHKRETDTSFQRLDSVLTEVAEAQAGE